MNFVDLKKSLKEKMLSCYVVEGEDIYLLYRSLEMIKESAGQNFPEINEVIFSENNYTLKDVVDACLVMPIGGDKRLVIVKDCAVKANADAVAELNRYLEKPVEDCVLVFFNTVKNELCTKLKNVERVNCNKLEGELVKKYVASLFQKEGKVVGAGAISILCEFCLYNLGRISGEVTKLANLAGEGEVTVKMVEDNVNKDLDYQIYEFSQAVAERNADKALAIFNDLMNKKEGVGLVIIGLYNQFSRMLFSAITPLTNAQIADILGVKEFAVKRFKQQAEKFSKVALKDIVLLISQTEFDFKSGKVDGKNACQNLIFKIISY